MTAQKTPKVLIVMLCTHCTIGGAEKRYARTFEMLVDNQPQVQHRLLISKTMLRLLQESGVLLNIEANLIVLDTPKQHSQKITATKRAFLKVTEVLWYIRQCKAIIRQYKPDVVHPLLTGVYFCLPALMKKNRPGYVISAYSSAFKSLQEKKILGISAGAIAKRYAMQHCDIIDALSDSIRADLGDHGIDKQKIQVAPCSFTDVSKCHPSPQKKSWVVFLGRLIPNKNALLFIQAIPEVIQHLPDVHFYVLGKGPQENEIKTTIRELAIEDYVSVQFHPNPTDILNESSIFASLQELENYPSQSLLEAMACGNAIVATDVRETWRLVDEQNGYRVPATPSAIAKALIDLFEDPELYKKQEHSRQRILQEHNPERFYDYIVEIYYTVANRN